MFDFDGLDEPAPAKSAARGEEKKPTAAAPTAVPTKATVAKVCVGFRYRDQRWVHDFEVPVKSTILDLKRKMTPEHTDEALWFKLLNRGKRMEDSDLVDGDMRLDFEYDPPEGARLPEPEGQSDRKAKKKAELESKVEAARRQAASKRAEYKDAQRKAAAEAEVEKHDVTVIVYIDQRLGISTTYTVKSATTILALKELMAKDDPTGKTTHKDFQLVDINDRAQLLDDATLVTGRLLELEIREAS